MSLSNQLQTQFTVCVAVGRGFPSDTHDDEGRWALIGAAAASPLPAAAAAGGWWWQWVAVAEKFIFSVLFNDT